MLQHHPNYMQQNHLISEDEGDKNLVAIYFSSNGAIDRVNTNYFEFYKTRIQKASKHIYLRDVNCLWYSKGISNEINSPEALLNFLKKETEGKKVITIGSSAGGYAAILFGVLLGAKRIFAFSPQIAPPANLNSQYNLPEMIAESDVLIYYTLPYKNEEDFLQYQKVQNLKNIRLLPILSSHHGVPLEKNILKKILNSDTQRLNVLYSAKPIKERYFVFKYFGLKTFLQRMISKNLKKAPR